MSLQAEDMQETPLHDLLFATQSSIELDNIIRESQRQNKNTCHILMFGGAGNGKSKARDLH